jgi:hypothetical protein
MARKTHLVGAWPGFSGARAMDTALSRLGPHLLRMTDGETGERSQWIAPAIDWMRANPDVEMTADGDFSDYERGPSYRLRDGRQLDPANIELGYYRAFQRSYPAFRVLRERSGYPDISFQVGLPAPIDLANSTLVSKEPQADPGKALVRRVDPAIVQSFGEATLREIAAIHAEALDDVIFQVESVVAMVAVARSAPEAQQAVATRMAESIIAMVALAPEGVRFGIHICLGDFHHRALAELGSARPVVTLANTLAKLWPAGRPLEYIHAPFAAAEKPGSLDPTWYEPLDELALPDGVRFVAGFVHEDVDIDELRKIHAMIERHAGREVDVAATCGLGRRPSPDQAWDAMDKVVALLT